MPEIVWKIIIIEYMKKKNILCIMSIKAWGEGLKALAEYR